MYAHGKEVDTEVLYLTTIEYLNYVTGIRTRPHACITYVLCLPVFDNAISGYKATVKKMLWLSLCLILSVGFVDLYSVQVSCGEKCKQRLSLNIGHQGTGSASCSRVSDLRSPCLQLCMTRRLNRYHIYLIPLITYTITSTVLFFCLIILCFPAYNHVLSS